MHFSFRPKDDYMEKATYKELDELAAVWKSQVTFCQEEIAFFKSLLEQSSNTLFDKQQEQKLHRLSVLLDRKSNEVKTLLGRIDMHTVYIEELAEGIYGADEQQFRKDNSNLEDRVCRFLLTFDKLKAEVMKVLQSDQNKRA